MSVNRGGDRNRVHVRVSARTAYADEQNQGRTRRQIGACRVRPLFTGQNSQLSRRCEEGRHRATLGAAVSNRVSADAVGRRGRFPEGRPPPQPEKCCPLREMHRAGAIGGPGIGSDLNAPPKAGDENQNPRPPATSDSAGRTCERHKGGKACQASFRSFQKNSVPCKFL